MQKQEILLHHLDKALDHGVFCVHRDDREFSSLSHIFLPEEPGSKTIGKKRKKDKSR